MLSYRLKHRWRNGTTHILFEPVELLERLAALVPAPRTHLLKYHGVLGPCAGWRDRIVPAPPGGVRSVLLGEVSAKRSSAGADPAAVASCGEADSAPSERGAALAAPVGGSSLVGGDGEDRGCGSMPGSGGEGARARRPRRKNRSWADLMQRVFELDTLECPACGGRLRVIAAIQDPEAIRAILDSLGLDSRPPPPPSPTISGLF